MAKRQQRRRRERRRQHAERRTRRTVITGASVTAGAVLGISSPALAHDFTVNRGGDAGDGTCDSTCTFRDAVGDSNENFEADNIYFESNLSGSTITLTAGDLPITTYGLSIHGPGSDQLTISGNDADRIFYVDTISTEDNVAISGLTLTDGAADYGGAIHHRTGDLRVTDSVLTGNFANNDGGAIYDYGGSYLGVRGSTLNGNTAGDDGGAIYAGESFGFIVFSTLAGNTAVTGSGGGIAEQPGNTRGYLIDSTVSGNSADDSGGGLIATLASAQNTILANNTAATNNDIDADNFAASSSLIEDLGDTTAIGLSNITGVDPQLGVLGDNGGPTPTLKPAANSPVVDKGDSSYFLDQRDLPRTVDNPDVANVADGTDIGSVELTLAEGPHAPTADAGADKVVASGALVNLTGTGSADLDGDTLTYAWTQTGGAGVTLAGANTATPSLTAPTGPATLAFELEVCDPRPLCDTDTVAVNVEAPGGPSPTPTNPAPGPIFDLKAAINKCKKKFPAGPRRKKCIKKAKRRAGVAARPAGGEWAALAWHLD